MSLKQEAKQNYEQQEDEIIIFLDGSQTEFLA